MPAQPTVPGARGRRDIGTATRTAPAPASSMAAAARSRSARVGTSSITRPEDRTARGRGGQALAGCGRRDPQLPGPSAGHRVGRRAAGPLGVSRGPLPAARASGVFSASVRTRSPSASAAVAGNGSRGIASDRASSRTSRPSSSSTRVRASSGRAHALQGPEGEHHARMITSLPPPETPAGRAAYGIGTERVADDGRQALVTSERMDGPLVPQTARSDDARLAAAPGCRGRGASCWPCAPGRMPGLHPATASTWAGPGMSPRRPGSQPPSPSTVRTMPCCPRRPRATRRAWPRGASGSSTRSTAPASSPRWTRTGPGARTSRSTWRSGKRSGA